MAQKITGNAFQWVDSFVQSEESMEERPELTEQYQEMERTALTALAGQLELGGLDEFLLNLSFYDDGYAFIHYQPETEH